MSESTEEPEEGPPTTVDSIDAIAITLVQGFARLNGSRIASNLAKISILSLRHPGLTPEEQRNNAIESLREVTPVEFDMFQYVTNTSELVYATTLLDSFLSEVTKFLLLLHPKSMSGEQPVKLRDVLAAESTLDLVNDAATKQARELGYRSFLDRIEFLRERFGLRLKLKDTALKSLEHFSSVRNILVHDQSIFDLRRTPTGTVEVSQRTCPRHPTPVSDAERQDAQVAYREVASALYEAVCTQVLKRSEGDQQATLQAVLRALDPETLKRFIRPDTPDSSCLAAQQADEADVE